MADRAPLVVAHRACPHHAPENSLLGIRRAADLGADVVEVDVRLSVEGRPVLLHDRTLRRATGLVGPPTVRREAAIRAREIGAGERVPSFAEALDAVPAGMLLAVHVKVPRAVHPVLAEVANQHAETRVLLWSGHPSVVRFTTERRPAIEASLVQTGRMARGSGARFAAAARARAAGIWIRWAALTPAFADEARQRGLRTYAQCPTPEVPAAALALLDGVISDWPDAARAAVATLDGA